MSNLPTKKIFFAILSIASGTAIAFIHWFLVDPFHIRALPSAFRYLISGAAGLFFGWLIYLAAGILIKRRKILANPWVLLTFAMAGVVLYFVLPLYPAPNRLSTTYLNISVTNQPRRVRLESIRLNGEALIPNTCTSKGDWRWMNDLYIVEPGKNVSLSCMVVLPKNTSIAVSFFATDVPVIVKVGLENQVKDVNLSITDNNRDVVTKFSAPAKTAFYLVYLIRFLDALFLLALIAGLILADQNRIHAISEAVSASRAEFSSFNFNDWFEETTARFHDLAVFALIVSGLLSAFLFLQLEVIGKRPSPAQYTGQKTPPNILWIVVDALSAEDMATFGYDLPTTSGLDPMIQDWTQYSKAQSAQTCSIGALATFSTGRYHYTDDYASIGDMADQQEGWLSMPQTLKQAGYTNWWYGYLTPGYYRLGSGFDDNVCQTNNPVRSFLNRSWFKDRAITKTAYPFLPLSFITSFYGRTNSSDDTSCADIGGLTSFLQNQRLETPFFVYYHFSGVHGPPYGSGDSLGEFLPLDAGLITKAQQSKVYGKYSLAKQPQVDNLRLRYDEAVDYETKKIGEFLKFIQQQSWYDSTMVILTADHGQNFNNGYSSHCTPLASYPEGHVPLLIKYPQQTQGKKVDTLVSTIDLFPTILDLAGFQYSSSWFDGISLLKQEENPDPSRIVFTKRGSIDSGYPTMFAAVGQQYRLVNRITGLALFDYIHDPQEKVDLIDNERTANLPEVIRLKQAMKNYLSRQLLIHNGKPIIHTPLVPKK